LAHCSGFKAHTESKGIGWCDGKKNTPFVSQ
jgi:hypothetical protein